MGGNMIEISQIDHINMTVNCLAKSIEFYGDNFGFKLMEDHSTDEEPWAVIGIPDKAYLCLYEHPGRKRPGDEMTINHFGFVVDDFEHMLKTLKTDGIEVLYGGPLQWARSRSAYIVDPSGYEIELVENIGGGLEEI